MTSGKVSVDKSSQSIEAPGQATHSVRGFLHGVVKDLEKRYHCRQPISGISTGFSHLDDATSGLQAGQLIVIAARPSMGKTALALNIGTNAAFGTGIPVLILSLALDGEGITQSILCAEAQVDSLSFKNGWLGSRDWVNITKAAGRVAEAPVSIVELRAPTIEQIRLKIDEWRQNKEIFTEPSQRGVVIIDYFRMIRAQGPYIGEKSGMIISRGLKDLAIETQLTIIVTAGLSSWVDKNRANKRPTLSDFTEHEESLAEDADTIYFLYRDEVYNQTVTDSGIAELIIAKQRHGPIGMIPLRFLHKCGRFENIAEELSKP